MRRVLLAATIGRVAMMDVEQHMCRQMEMPERQMWAAKLQSVVGGNSLPCLPPLGLKAHQPLACKLFQLRSSARPFSTECPMFAIMRET